MTGKRKTDMNLLILCSGVLNRSATFSVATRGMGEASGINK